MTDQPPHPPFDVEAALDRWFSDKSWRNGLDPDEDRKAMSAALAAGAAPLVKEIEHWKKRAEAAAQVQEGE